MPFNNTIQGGVANRLAEVDANLQIQVALNTDMTKAGVVRVYAENDPGEVTGTATGTPPEASDNFRLAIGQDQILDLEAFSYAAQNTAKHIVRTTTQTLTYNSQYIQTNGAGVTTINTGCLIQTYVGFQVTLNGGLYWEHDVAFTNWAITNTTIDFGHFLAAATTPYAPTDGVFFRVTAAGIFGVANFNGVETVTAVFLTAPGGTAFVPAFNQFYKCAVTYCPRRVKFWINDVLYGELVCPDGQGKMTLSSQLPFAVRHAISGIAASGAISLRMSDYAVVNIDLAQNLPASFIASAMGHNAYQGVSGGTMGTTALYANSTNPVAAVPTNTTAALGAGLGGNFWHTNTLAVNTDGIISSFQVPALSILGLGRALVITGVQIDTVVQTTLANAGGAAYCWSLAFGHTAVSLATAEAATTKAPRRIALGSQGAIGALAQGAQLTTIDVNFGTAPITVNPGEFIQTVVKNIGTVGTAGTLAHLVTFTGFWK